MFWHYIAIFREHSWYLLRDAQLRSSRQNIVDGRVVSCDVGEVISDRHAPRHLPYAGPSNLTEDEKYVNKMLFRTI
jgi:hypothetical protein